VRAPAGEAGFDGGLLTELGGRLLDLGAAVVAIKLGDRGLYLRTSPEAGRLAAMGAGWGERASAWAGRELLVPCFEVRVVGTTGAGDCAIAGLLAAIAKGLSPEEAATAATAVGACNCEAADSTSGVPHWSAVRERIARGWRRRELGVDLPGWHHDAAAGLWRGPKDRR
jgi:sugar/nucleoside kinase (ribokinase family)